MTDAELGWPRTGSSSAAPGEPTGLGWVDAADPQEGYRPRRAAEAEPEASNDLVEPEASQVDWSAPSPVSLIQPAGPFPGVPEQFTPGTWSPPAAVEPSLPVVPTRYTLFWRTPAWRGWRPIVTIVVALISFLAVMTILPLIGIGLDLLSGRLSVTSLTEQLSQGQIPMSPAVFITNNLGLALCIPLSLLWARAFFRQRPGWFLSVTGRFRWRWFGLVVLVLTPVWLIATGIDTVPALLSGELQLHVTGDTWPMILGIALTTPLQCAGEEFAARGLFNRAAASFVPEQVSRWIGPLLGALLSSALFMFAHSAQDHLLNLFYFSFGLVACWLTWRTGGLEAAIAMHLVNNLTAMIVLPFSDISGLFDRQEGAAQASDLALVLPPMLIALLLIELVARRSRVVTTSAPGQSLVAPA